MENVLEINSLNKTYGGKFKAIDEQAGNLQIADFFVYRTGSNYGCHQPFRGNGSPFV